MSPVRLIKSKKKTTNKSKLPIKKRFINFFTVSNDGEWDYNDNPSGLTPKRKINWKRSSIAAILILVVGIAIGLRVSAVTARGVYADWTWPSTSSGFTEFEHGLTINQVTPNAPFFWSHQFRMVGGDGGYIGLQSNGNRVNGTSGKTAVFSVFGSALSGTTGSCVLESKGFDGYNTSGTSCRVPFDWQAGREYKLKVKKISTDSTGHWWQGSIKDTFTGTETVIAKIKIPRTWTGLGTWSVMWTEYFGAQPSSCSALPYSNVTFSAPTANGGKIKPVRSNRYLSSTYTCSNSSINVINNIYTQQKVGNTPSASKLLVNDKDASVVVKCAYGAFMGRNPDPSGSAYWTKKYIDSGYNLKVLARGLLYSNEGKSKSQLGFSSYITRLYSSCLGGRVAPQADINTWTVKYLAGLTKEDIFVFVVMTAGRQLT